MTKCKLTYQQGPHKNFIRSIEIDGKVIKNKRISHADLIRAKKITFNLNLLPNERNYDN